MTSAHSIEHTGRGFACRVILGRSIVARVSGMAGARLETGRLSAMSDGARPRYSVPGPVLLATAIERLRGICNSFGSALVKDPAKSAGRFLVGFVGPFVGLNHGSQQTMEGVGHVRKVVGVLRNV